MVELRIGRVIKEGCSPKPLDCFDIFCLKIVNLRFCLSEAEAQCISKGLLAFTKLLPPQNSDGLINV
jgi:hypothetical protein